MSIWVRRWMLQRFNNSGAVTAPAATSAIIQEGSAFYILLEDGVSKILLE